MWLVTVSRAVTDCCPAQFGKLPPTETFRQHKTLQLSQTPENIRPCDTVWDDNLLVFAQRLMAGENVCQGLVAYIHTQTHTHRQTRTYTHIHTSFTGQSFLCQNLHSSLAWQCSSKPRGSGRKRERETEYSIQLNIKLYSSNGWISCHPSVIWICYGGKKGEK